MVTERGVPQKDGPASDCGREEDGQEATIDWGHVFRNPSQETRDFYARLGKTPGAVGLNDEGILCRVTDTGEVVPIERNETSSS